MSLRCLFRLLCCCECPCFEAGDDWTITQEARKTENGAGFLYKRGKGAALWSKRFFVITDSKLVYYLEADRANMKGEIVLAGAIAKLSSNRTDGHRKYYFCIEHPVCGTRELYAKTSHRRALWIQKINEMSSLLSKNTINDKLWKLGGSLINAWQERWVIVSGTSLDYFEAAKDNQSKGSVNLVGSKVRSYSTRERQYIFEVTNHILESGKRREKRISFAVKDEDALKLWISTIRKAGSIDGSNSSMNMNTTSTSTLSESPNPLLESGLSPSEKNNLSPQNNNDEVESAATTPSMYSSKHTSLSLRSSTRMDDNRSTESPSSKSSRPAEKIGWLNKKSPNILGLYQKRFFVLANGELLYFKSEEEYKGNRKPCGDISCRDIPIPKGLEIYEKQEVLLKARGRIYQLRAENYTEAASWVDAITEWCNYSRKEKL